MSSKIPLSYYQSDDVVFLARDLLGKLLFTSIGGQLTGGMITETEAYAGVTDRASHAYGGRRTKRTSIMYARGGHAYVYLCYGVHYLFNVVTAGTNKPHAVLIRGLVPVVGFETICERRQQSGPSTRIADGPGKLTRALGITLAQNGLLLDGNEIWLEDRGLSVRENDIFASRRIGVSYAGTDALLPYRFNLQFEHYLQAVASKA